MRQSKKQQYTVFEFMYQFPDDDSAKQYLYDRKWKDGYFCRKCKGTTGYSVVSDGFTRQCNKCDYRESVTSGTLFHKIKFPLWKAFWIVYQMAQRKIRRIKYGTLTVTGLAPENLLVVQKKGSRGYEE